MRRTRDDDGGGGRAVRARADSNAPLLALPAPVSLLTTAIQAIRDTTDPIKLFQVDTENGPKDNVGREADARRVRNQLLLQAHPDRGPPDEKPLRDAATVNINTLFDLYVRSLRPVLPSEAGASAELQNPEAIDYAGGAGSSGGGAGSSDGKADSGLRVRIRRLLSEPRKSLNGSYGNVEGEEDGRVLVRVDGHDQLFKLKPENLRRVDAATVRGGALEFLQLQAETEFEDLDAHGRAVSKSPSLLYSEGGPQSHRFKLQTYSGFGFANMLDLSDPSVPFFDPMAANRCVSDDVVATRVTQNLVRVHEGLPYHDFGLISLAAVRYPPEKQHRDGRPRFFVLDGQHRLMAMKGLVDEGPARAPGARDIRFQISVRVVDDMEAANAALREMQDCYMPDLRCFFDTEGEGPLAGEVLALARLRWPRAFVRLDIRADRRGSTKLVPDRPKLDDGCFFTLLRDAGMLARGLKEVKEGRAEGSTLANVLFAQLLQINDAIRAAGPPGNRSEARFRQCEERESGCWLGYYRPDEDGEKTLEALARRGLV
jgi:hypothetical protein